MTEHDVDDLPRDPWGAPAAYFYILDLEGPALAWEYLRRHPQYRADWSSQQRNAWGERWGLRWRRRSKPRRARGATDLGSPC